MKIDRLKNLVVYVRTQLRRGSDMTKLPVVISTMPKTRGICSVLGCGRPHYAMGLCQAHYKRKRLGQAMDVPIGNVRPRLKRGAVVSVATKVTPAARQTLEVEAERQGVSPYVFLSMLIEKFHEVTVRHETRATPPVTKAKRKGRKPRG